MKTPTICADGMYPKSFTKAGLCKHSRFCTGAFGRYDLKCHRCVALMRGAMPRDGWMADYLAKKVGEVQRSFNW